MKLKARLQYLYTNYLTLYFTLLGIKGSIVICVSPLASLMMDQRNKFVPKGINCDFVGEAQTDKEAISKVVAGKIQLVFISPESIICNTLYRGMLMSSTYKEKIAALVIDEAHCVKTW